MINAPAKALTLRLTGITLEFDFDFNVWSEPEWLKDAGTGSISVSGGDISIDLQPRSVNGTLRVDYSDVKIHTRDYTVNLKGNSDISRAVETMLKDFKVFFEEELTSMLASRLAIVTEEILNEKLLLKLDQASLLLDPIFKRDFVSFVLDGSLKSCDSEVSAYPLMPVYLKDETEKVHFEQFVSEMTLSSALATLQDSDELVFPYNVTSEFLTKVIPNFETVFSSKHDSIVVKFAT